MSKINPLYLIITILFLLLILFFKMNSIQNKITIISYSNEKLKVFAEHINALKKEFSNKNQTLSKLKDTLRKSALQKNEYQLRTSSTSISLTISNINNQKASSVLSKIINNSFKVLKFKLDDKNLSQSITMKIAL